MSKKKTKLYRKRYFYLTLSKSDLKRLIELFQVYSVTPTLLLSGRRIETPDTLDLLADSVSPEFIATGLAPRPTVVDSMTSSSPVLQLRLTEKRGDLFIVKDAVADFQELIDQINDLLTRCTDRARRMRVSLVNSILSGLGAGLGQFLGKLDHQATLPNFLCFLFFNACFIASIVGLFFWIWQTRVTKTPGVILSLDQRQVKAMSKHAKKCEILGLIIIPLMAIGLYVGVIAFWSKLGYGW